MGWHQSYIFMWTGTLHRILKGIQDLQQMAQPEGQQGLCSNTQWDETGGTSREQRSLVSLNITSIMEKGNRG